jgi:hypothetical protein
MNEAGSGEYFSFKLDRQRQNWRNHRKHMGMISDVFKAQERIKDFEAVPDVACCRRRVL